MSDKHFFSVWILHFFAAVITILPCKVHAFNTQGNEICPLETQWYVHDMRELTSKSFKVIGADPFVVSGVLDNQPVPVKGFFLQLILPSEVKEHRLQCYWETDKKTFSEENSFHFVLRGGQNQYQVFLPTYFFDTLDQIQRIRFDVDPGTDNLLSIVSFGVVKNVLPHLLSFIPESVGTQIMEEEAVLRLPVKPQHPGTLHIDKTWSLHDLERLENGRLRITGKDPYLESPELDLDTSQVKGIYLDLLSDDRHAPCKMQLFWKSYVLDYSSERRPFNEQDSYWFWLEFSQNRSEVYLPLSVVDPKDFIKAIRLDFASCQNMVFAIQQIAVVDNVSQELLSHLPRQIAYRNMAAIPERRKSREFIVNWKKLVGIDRFFWGVYLSIFGLVFIAFCTLGFWKRVCRGS